MSNGTGKLGAAFSIGGDQAEADPLLDEAFYDSSHFELISSHDDPRCFVVGRTGSGKSAVLKRLAEVSPEKVVRIVPEDLSMPYITDLDVVNRLDELGVDLAPFWKALWRHVLIVEVIRHRYKVDSSESKANMIDNLRTRMGRNPGKKQALAYLDEFEGKFWAETDERVKEITTSLTKRIEASSDVRLRTGIVDFGASGAGATAVTETERRELAQRFQRVVNETQLARLNKMIEVLDEDVLSSTQDFTYIVIDDLDKDWVDSKILNDLILALFKTVHDLKRVRHLKVLVALRTNMFTHLDFGSSSGGQEEKYRSLVLDMRWDKTQLLSLIDERIRVASRKHRLSFNSMSELLPNNNAKRGAAMAYILDRTLLRPRDLLSFIRECLSKSVGKGQISWEAINRAELPYSENRFLALRDEWKPQYPGIEDALRLFQGCSDPLDRQQLTAILEDCALLSEVSEFRGGAWLSAFSVRIFEVDRGQSWAFRYGALLRLLYDIGFVGVEWPESSRPIFSSDDDTALKSDGRLDEVQHFYVARMFHAALDVHSFEAERP